MTKVLDVPLDLLEIIADGLRGNSLGPAIGLGDTPAVAVHTLMPELQTLTTDSRTMRLLYV